MSAPNNPNAFPCTGEGYKSECYTQYGMTLRDWFAGQALAGLLAAPWMQQQNVLDAADWAYAAADAMLAERAKAGAV